MTTQKKALLAVICIFLLAALTFPFHSYAMPRGTVPQKDLDLLNAVKDGDAAKVKELLASGANANVKDTKGGTALTFAAEKGRNEIIKLLLDNKADVNKKCGIDSMTALMFAAIGNHLETVKLLLERGADINAADYYGVTALMHTARWGDTKTVELLLAKGADRNAKDKYGMTALMHATEKGRSEIEKLLTGSK